MRKLIDIPEGDGVLEKLKKKAEKNGRSLKNYIEQLLIKEAKKK